MPDTGGSALARRARILAEEGRLKKWAAENGKLKGKLPTEQARGSEHTVQLGEGTARVIKATRPDSHRGYGIAMGDNDRGATPSEYLDRIAQQNRLFEDDIRLERIVSNGGKLSIVISQPFIKGRAATPPEIDAYMAGKGMEKVAAGTYYLPGEQLLITDAHPKNVRVDGNGIIHPIDPVIQRADAEFVSFLRSAPHLIDANFLPAGKEWHATTPSAGLPVKGKYELREAKDLVTSFDAGFDPALQPRDRTREASVNQIAGIVQKFEPQRLGEAPTTDLGAPVIDDAGQVLSGNGRVTSLRTIYGAQDASRGEGYKQFLMQNAEQFGFKPADIAAMKEPVLVRRVEDFGGLAKAEFARQSNQSQLLAMSGAEKAAADARLLTEHPDILDKFAPSEEGNVMATSNHEFLNHFIAATGDQAELLSGKGYNNELVRKRVETAILATVIGPENRKLITQMIERADKFKMRKAVNGLMMSAPSLVKLKGTAYDLSAYLSQAMGDLVRMRGASENVETFLASKPLVGDDGRTAASDHILEFLSKAKSQKQVAEDLRRYLFMAKNAISDAQSGGLFGDTPRSREQLLGEIYGRIIRPAEPAAVAAPAAPSAFADLIPVEAAQPAPSPAPVAAQPVAPPAAVRPAPVAPSGVTAPPTPPPRPRNAVVADWSFHKGTPRLMAGAGGFMPTGSALRASASEIVHHTREQAAYDFAERMEGMPRSAGARLARDFIRKAEARQMPSLPATERTRRAAAALAIIPPAEVASQLIQGGLNGAQRHMETYLPASSTR